MKRNPSWRVISIGYLCQNHLGKEETDPSSRDCTCTLIETGNRRILVDPSMESPEQLAQALYHRTGLLPDQIDSVFLTHFHRHHRRSLALFRKSVWLMSRTEIRWEQSKEPVSEPEKDLLARMVPVEDFPIEGVDVLPTPGHTHGTASLVFETREGIVVVAGDAILTFDHFDDREPSENCEDPKAARRSIDIIAKMADLVVPGHDNFFVV